MYKRLFLVSILSVFLLTFAFGTVLAQDDEPLDSCTLNHPEIEESKFTFKAGANKDWTEGAEVGPTGSGLDNETDDWGTICILEVIYTVVDWIFIFLLSVAVAFIAIAGFMWMTAGAAPERQKKAGGMLMAAVIGIVIALLARVIPALITGILL